MKRFMQVIRNKEGWGLNLEFPTPPTTDLRNNQTLEKIFFAICSIYYPYSPLFPPFPRERAPAPPPPSFTLTPCLLAPSSLEMKLLFLNLCLIVKQSKINYHKM